MKELIDWAKGLKILHPDKASEISDLIDLCNSEIEEGGSYEHEIELCREAIKQLIEEE